MGNQKLVSHFKSEDSRLLQTHSSFSLMVIEYKITHLSAGHRIYPKTSRAVLPFFQRYKSFLVKH